MSVTSSPAGYVTRPPTGAPNGGPLDSLPSGYIFKAMLPNLVDSVGLSITDAQNIDRDLWDIFFVVTDGVPVSKRADADIAVSAFASPKLNESCMIGAAGTILVLYPIGTAESVLIKARKYVKALVFFGGAIIGSATEFGLPKTPGWFVDSVNGLDTNSGTSKTEPLKTIAALLAKTIATGDCIGLAAGSHWRETITIPADRVIVGSYGSGDAPIIDGADIATGWVQDGTHTNTYTISDTMPDDQVNVNQCVWEDGEPLDKVASAAACNSTPGSFYYSTITANVAYTIYIHPTDSTDPATNGKTYEISKRKFCIETTLNEDNVSVLGPIVFKRGYGNGGVLRLAGVNQYARQVECYSESLHTVYLSQGELSGIKTVASNLPSGANDIVFIQSPPLVDPSTAILSDFECVDNSGTGLNQALLVHDDAIKRVHFRRGHVRGYNIGAGAQGLNGCKLIFQNVDFRNIAGTCIDRDDTTATEIPTETYIINCILHSNGNFPVKITNMFATSKLYLYRCFVITGTGYGIFQNVSKGGIIQIDHSIITRATQGGDGIVSTEGIPGLDLTVNNSIIYGFDAIYSLYQNGATFHGDSNVYFGQVKLATFNDSGYWELGPWQTATGADAGSIIADPLFVTDPRTINYPDPFNFATQALSPAKSRFAGIADMPASYTAPAWVDAEVAALVNY